jgi:oligoribonuclease NrnB/cAMP/cGMP phosphodiesterase (DHH superfamily)
MSTLTKPTLVCYHENCVDGFTAATVAYLNFRDNADYMSVQYGKQYDLELFKGKDVLILDFSFSREICEQINEVAKSLLIIDHHKTAQEALAGLKYAKFDMTRSGAWLTWMHFYPYTYPSIFVELVSDYDTWNHKCPDVKHLNKGLRVHDFSFEFYAPLVSSKDYSDMLPLIEAGKSIEAFTDQQVKSLTKHAVKSTIAREVGLMVNASSVFISDLGHELAKQSGTYGAVFTITSEGEVLVSLRSVGDYDVSVIAKEYGGGGHMNAAGFKVPLECLGRYDGGFYVHKVD